MDHAVSSRITPEQAVQMYFDTVRQSNPSDQLLEAVDRAQAAEQARILAQVQRKIRKRRRS
jgi:hypothetical protein